MLTLSRKPGQRILIGEGITVMVVKISANTVRLGIDAPKHIPIAREEVAVREAIQRESSPRPELATV